jgi:hypothetical protein
MAIKTYNYNDNTQLSKNFNIREFRCKCYSGHSIKNDTVLDAKLQELTDKIHAKSVTISSGHRCQKHDRNVGGSGYGPHVDGYAADCCFWDENGKPISTKLISCVAQDMGFMGIANITWDYAWIHLDMKGRVYKGNEIINYNTVTNDFYKYYGITKEQIKKLVGENLTNNNTSSTSNETKINNKDKSVKKVTWSNKYSDDIKELQNILNNKGYQLMEDGFAGPNTYAVCKKFIVEKGDRGPLTYWVQKQLKNKKYYEGMLDGIAGNQTMTAIANWQKNTGLGQGYLGGTDWVYLLGGKFE